MMRSSGILMALSLAPAACSMAAPTVRFDPETKTILVYGHSRAGAATPATLAATDQAAGWGAMTRDAANLTTTVAANLTIGRNDGSSTWLQVGGPQEPSETLVVQGKLTIGDSKVLSWNRYEGTNGLALGDPETPSSSPSLRFERGESLEAGLVLQEGCTLHAFGARIGALTAERARWATWLGSPKHLRLVGCVLSGFRRLKYFQTSGKASDAVVKSCVFEHMGVVFGNGWHYLEDCTFRNVGCALFDGGALSATVVRCRFEDNETNWRLGATSEGIRAIDCTFGPPNKLGPRIRSHFWPKTQTHSYPLFIAERHVVVEVRDERARPVVRARVTVTCEQPQSPTGALVAVTGPDGRTRGHALRLTDFVHQATDAPNRPRTTSYTYALRAEAPGYRPCVLSNVDPDASWRVKTIALRP